MIKRLIFDLDNTLIMWDNDYYITLDQTFKYFNIEYNEEIKNNLIKAVDDYESVQNTFNYKTLNDLMKEYSNIDLPNNFTKIWTKHLEYAIPKEEDKELIDVLEYLSSKYELVVLTNWFTHQQKQRLKKYGILKYFKEVIGTDQVINKPNKEAFVKACGKYNITECVMIGDSLKTDIEGALNIGLRAVLFDYKKEYLGNIENIKEIRDLKNIF